MTRVSGRPGARSRAPRTVAAPPEGRYDPAVPRIETFAFDGLRVPVEVWGSGSRMLVFFPGMGVHPAYYRAGVRALARRFKVFVPDLSFRTHRTLFEEVAGYVQFAEAFAERYAPGAPRAGHSFGGLLALLGTAPAIACSPLVPLRIGWLRLIGRAARLQVREYLGREGLPGVRWAWGILRDYLAAAVRSPRALFPALSRTLSGLSRALLPRTGRAHVILARHDLLYLPRESERYLALLPERGLTVRRLDTGHDWPVTRPDLLLREVDRAARRLADGAATGGWRRSG